MTTIGSFVPGSVLASWPLLASNCSTWSRTHWALLGTYSPVIAMPPSTADLPAVRQGRSL